MPHPVVHFEIGCRDTARTSSFYASMFGWNIQNHGPAAMIDTGGGKPGGPPAMGINGHIHSLGHEPHNYVTVYVQVDDIGEYLKKAEKLGGKTVVPQQEVPGMGHFAWFTDPEGTCIGLWKPMAR